MNRKQFKRCNACRRWFSFDDVLHNPEIRPLGMLVSVNDAYEAYYLFLHDIPICQSSFVIEVDYFKHLLEHVPPPISNFRTNSCEGHCANLMDLEVCGRECRNAPYRRLLLEMQVEKNAQPV